MDIFIHTCVRIRLANLYGFYLNGVKYIIGPFLFCPFIKHIKTNFFWIPQKMTKEKSSPKTFSWNLKLKLSPTIKL